MRSMRARRRDSSATRTAGKAIELTREAFVTDPLRAFYYENLAGYFYGLNRLDEAERAIRRAIELLPNASPFTTSQ